MNGGFKLLLQKNLKDKEKAEEIANQFYPAAELRANSVHPHIALERISELQQWCENIMAGVANLDTSPIPYPFKFM